MTLPTDPKARKDVPIYSGCLKYFPRALAAVANLSRVGNEQHNPGKPLHWDRSKSTDEHDALTRHLIEAGTIDTDGQRHSTKVAWRALAALEKELERADTARVKFDGTGLSVHVCDDNGVPLAWVPKVGDCVLVTGTSWGGLNVHDEVGTIYLITPSEREGYAVQFLNDKLGKGSSFALSALKPYAPALATR